MLLFTLTVACKTPTIEYIVQELPEFKLVDVNPNSSMYEQEISSLEFVNASPEKVSAWYFGHST